MEVSEAKERLFNSGNCCEQKKPSDVAHSTSRDHTNLGISGKNWDESDITFAETPPPPCSPTLMGHPGSAKRASSFPDSSTQLCNPNLESHIPLKWVCGKSYSPVEIPLEQDSSATARDIQFLWEKTISLRDSSQPIRVRWITLHAQSQLNSLQVLHLLAQVYRLSPKTLHRFLTLEDCSLSLLGKMCGVYHLRLRSLRNRIEASILWDGANFKGWKLERRLCERTDSRKRPSSTLSCYYFSIILNKPENTLQSVEIPFHKRNMAHSITRNKKLSLGKQSDWTRSTSAESLKCRIFYLQGQKLRLSVPWLWMIAMCVSRTETPAQITIQTAQKHLYQVYQSR